MLGEPCSYYCSASVKMASEVISNSHTNFVGEHAPDHHSLACMYTHQTPMTPLLRILAEQIVLPAALCILLVYTAINPTLGFTQQATCTYASAWARTHITKHEHNTVRLCNKLCTAPKQESHVHCKPWTDTKHCTKS